jgi:hypothetical protein
MGELDDRHVLERSEVLVGAAQGLTEDDGTDTQAGDGGSRKGSQRGNAGSGLRGGGKDEERQQEGDDEAVHAGH